MPCSVPVSFNFLLWSYFFPEPPCQLEKKVHIKHTLCMMEICSAGGVGCAECRELTHLQLFRPHCKNSWTFSTNLLELCRTYTKRTVVTLRYLKTVAAWPVSLLNFRNLNVQWTMCSSDVMCICELQENIQGSHFKYKWKLNINFSILK